MDLMGDIGLFDQLIATREENKVLSTKVKEFSDEMKSLRAENYALTVQNQALLAEVEEYRRSHLNLSKLSLNADKGNKGSAEEKQQSVGSAPLPEADHFLKSGNGIFPCEVAVTLKNLHGSANPLCCTLHPTDDSLLLTGGADGRLRLCLWGSALAPDLDASLRVVQSAATLSCSAPVISTAFLRSSYSSRGGNGISISGALSGSTTTTNLIAAGCMDGSIHFASYDRAAQQQLQPNATNNLTFQSLLNSQVIETNTFDSSSSATTLHAIKHGKYVKNLVWSPSEPILASASADGTVRLTKIISISGKNMTNIPPSSPMSIDEDEERDYRSNNIPPDIVTKQIVTLHLPGPVEAMTFLDNGNILCCYVRGMSYLSYFDLRDDCKQTKHSINGGSFLDNHVSFTIMSLHPSPIEGGKYLAAATDTSRNIIFEAGTHRQIRNLYGHQNDSYSNAKVAWSSNGQYLFGNTQEDSSICVWDVASSSIVRRSAGHEGSIRDIFSSAYSDTLATVSFDKTVKIWLNTF